MPDNLLHSVAVALWIAIPVVVAGLIHVVVIRLGLLRSLASVPLDFRITFGRRPLFGENKTLRGALVMIAATAGCFYLEAIVAGTWGASRNLVVPFQLAHPLVWGALAGAGYVAGELPNSFVKRRLGVAAGAIAGGGWRPIFWTIDQVDSVVGVVIFLLPVWSPRWPVVLALLGLTLVVHPLVALIMFCLGLKTRVG